MQTARYTFRSTDDHQNITTVATCELEALALMAFTAEKAHGIKPSRFELIKVDDTPTTPALF